MRRTRRALRDALAALVVEKGYAAVTVKSVLARADVGRSTFYAHFADKDALLLSGSEDLDAATDGPPDWLPFSRALFEHAGQHRQVYRAIRGHRGGAMLLEYMRRALVRRVQGDLAARAAGADALRIDVAARSVGGAFFAVLAWWIECSPRLSAAEVDAVFRSLTIPGLVAAVGRGHGERMSSA